MARIRIVRDDEVAWRRTEELVAAPTAAVMSRAEREADVRLLHDGAGGGLQLFEARIAPGETIALHAHAEDEIVYVLEGELRIGRKRLGPGASMFVAGNTLYGFSSGPEGVRFLNFRGRANTSFVSREAYLAARAGGADTPA